MGDRMPLDEAIQLERVETLFARNSALPSVTRPTAAGLNWLAVPSACAGLAYRVSNATTLEVISFNPIRVSLKLDLDAPIVALTCSSDGRLVAAACIDGSLRCYNATTNALEPRWTLENSHSHVVPDVWVPASTTRDYASSRAGPIHSLSFAPSGYALLLADAGWQTLSIYDAASSDPIDIAQGQFQNVTCATWSDRPDDLSIAVGDIQGRIIVGAVSLSPQSVEIKAIIPSPSEDDAEKEGFSTTHLHWFDAGKTLAAGYCRVVPSDEGDDEDEDDPADHEATLFVGPMESFQSSRNEVGDVIPFFSIPRFGRHVFYTTFLTSNEDTPILLVASNAASDVGVVAYEGQEWRVIDLQEGCGASTPTDDDDEYTFPMGFSTIPLTDGTQALLLASTDGSLSAFQVVNQNNPEAFTVNVARMPQGLAALSTTPVPPANLEILPTAVADIEPGQQSISNYESRVPAISSETHTEMNSGAGTPFSFGSPAFGQPSALNAAPAPATSFSFGTPGTSSHASSDHSKPIFGFQSTVSAFGSGGAVPTFGSTSLHGGGSSSGGFAALAASPAASSAMAFGSTISSPSPFSAFGGGKQGTLSAAGGSVPSSMIKPLFSNATSTTETISQQRKSVEMTPSSHLSTTTVPVMTEEAKTDRAGAKRAGMVFATFDTRNVGSVPLSKFEDMLDELGEGFHGDELDAQIVLIDPNGTNQMTRSAFVGWYVRLMEGDEVNDDNSMDSEERAERDEEKEKARKAFLMVASKSVSGGKLVIAETDFGKVMESMGTTYCEEEHRRTIKKLGGTDGMISWDAFIEWYMHWLFDNDEADSDDDGSEDEGEDEIRSKGGSELSSTMTRPTPVVSGWGNLFAQSKDSWKCDTCMVQNAASATECAACETPRPGLDKNVVKQGTSIALGGPSASSTSGIGASGFTFGTAAVSTAATGASKETPTTGSIFSFGIGSVGGTSESSSVSTVKAPASGFSLGTAVPKSGESEIKTKTSSTSVAYPPMSTKAPVPFGGGAGKPAGGGATQRSSSSSSTSGYPPMSLKAPVPFGGGETKSQSSTSSDTTKAKTLKTASSAYPLLSSGTSNASGVAQAGTVHNFSLSKSLPRADSLPSKIEHVSATALSSTGPNLFTNSKASTTDSTHSSWSTLPPRTSGSISSKSGTSAYPAMSSTAPTPYVSKVGETTGRNLEKSLSSVYAPTSSTVETSTSSSSAKSSLVPSTVPMPFPRSQTKALGSTGLSGTQLSHKRLQTLGSHSSLEQPAATEYETQFRKAIEQFRNSLRALADRRLPRQMENSDVQPVFDNDIAGLMNDKDQLVESCLSVAAQLSRQKERSLFLLSRKTDVERQFHESQRLVDEQHTHSGLQQNLVRSQPLDGESERFRRSLAVKGMMVHRSVETVEKRIRLLGSTFDVDEAKSCAISLQRGKMELFQALKLGFDRTQMFESESLRIAQQVSRLAKEMPMTGLAERHLMLVPHTFKRPLQLSGKKLIPRGMQNRLEPLSLSFETPQRSRPGQDKLPQPLLDSLSSVGKWDKIESILLRTPTESLSTRKLAKLSIVHLSSNEVHEACHKAPVTNGTSLLLRSEEVFTTREEYSTRSQGHLVFSSPATATRPGWNDTSGIDQARMKSMSLIFPHELIEISARNASREALASIGTTPEKVEQAIETKKRSESAIARMEQSKGTSMQRPKPLDRGSFKNNSSSGPTLLPTAPAPQGKAKLDPSFTTSSMPKSIASMSSSSYPPLPKQAPSPFSSNVVALTPESSSVGVSTAGKNIWMASQAPPQRTGPSAQSGTTNELSTSDKVEAGAFGSLMALEDTLSSSSKVSTKVTSPDFHSILKVFYEKHNPSKLHEVDKTLLKYKGREAEMFAKLAKKYGVASPLDSTAVTSTGPPAVGVAAPFKIMGAGPNAATTATDSNVSSPFGTNPSSAAQLRPTTASFGVSISPVSPSPFGAPSHAMNKSPFGQPTSSAMSPAFGTAGLASPSPFSQPGSAGGFGVSNDAPFLINGRNPHDVLVDFYQQYNPSKISEIDKVLTKYKNNEEQLFRALAKKYNLNPTAVFGIPSASPAAFGLVNAGNMDAGFGGLPAPLVGSPAAGAFGSITSSSLFGGSEGGGFGKTSSLRPSAPFGASARIGGNAFSSSSTSGGQSSFGSLVQPGATPSPSPFGIATASPNIGSSSGFGSASGGMGASFGGNTGFNSGATPFGAPRR